MLAALADPRGRHSGDTGAVRLRGAGASTSSIICNCCCSSARCGGWSLALLCFGVARMMTRLAVLGFLASAWTFVPEWAVSLAPRRRCRRWRPVLKLMTHNLFGLNYDMDRVAAAIAPRTPTSSRCRSIFPEQAGGLDALLKPRYPYSVRCQGGKRANLGLLFQDPVRQGNGQRRLPEALRLGERATHRAYHRRLHADATERGSR